MWQAEAQRKQMLTLPSCLVGQCPHVLTSIWKRTTEGGAQARWAAAAPEAPRTKGTAGTAER